MLSRLKKLKIVIAIFAIISLSAAIIPFVSNVNAATNGRDCDTNAVIYCGVMSHTELYHALNNGTSGPNQSSAQLKALFAKFGLSDLYDIDKMQDGVVTRSGQVIVGGKVVASGVKSIGRHYLAGSTQVAGIPYPLYMRAPSVSFLSNSLSAYVLMNEDGSMAMAVIRSCGNIVPGVGKRAPKFALKIRKWEDINGDAKKQDNEPFLSGWSFRIKGPNLDVIKTTDNKEGILLQNLPKGKYTIDEIQKSGWTNTTPLHREVELNQNTNVWFGNKKVEKKFEIKAVKFEDSDKDKIQDGDEKRLPGWDIELKGNGTDKHLTTNEDGEVLFEDLKAGTYTLTEKLQAGWENVTPITQTVTIPAGSTQNVFCVYFGNVKKVIPPEKKFRVEIIKFEDVNGNKTRDDREKPLEGWQFKIEGEGISKTVTTDGNGWAKFDDLKAGTYKVSEVLKEGWENTTGITKTVEIPENSDKDCYTIEFGNRKVVTPPEKKFAIKAFKFEDKDKDSKKDNDEKFLSDWQIRLKGDDVDKVLTTNEEGEVEFKDLKAGTYTVSESLKEGWTNITPIRQTVTIPKDCDKDEFEVFFGNVKKEVVPENKNMIKVIKFNDKNGDGKKEDGEETLSGWQMHLVGENVDKTLLTDTDGEVIFEGLKKGHYTVTETLQDGWINVTPLSETINLDEDGCTATLMFGNKKKETAPIPVTPTSTETVAPETPTTLPVSGPAEAVAGAFGTISIGGAFAYLRKGKKLFKLNIRKIK